MSLASWLFFVRAPSEWGRFVERAREQREAMADDRAASIDRWVASGLANARVVASFPTVIHHASGGGSGRAEPGVGPQEHLDALLNSFLTTQEYRAITVLDRDEVEIASVPSEMRLAETCRQLAHRCRETARPMVDAHLHGGVEAVIVFAAPVMADREPARAVGVVLVAVDPDQWLFPFLRNHPDGTATGETVLVGRDGDEAVLISPLRHDAAPPLTRRVPLTTPDLAGAVALEGGGAFASHVDYRGVPVFAAPRALKNTPWGLVVKVDRAEVRDAYRRWFAGSAAVGGSLAAAFAGLGFGLWRRQRARHQVAQARAEARFALLLEHASDALFFVARDGTIREANARAHELYGYERAALRGRQVAELRPTSSRAEVAAILRDTRPGVSLHFETDHIRRDGSEFPVEVSSRLVALDDEEVFLSIVRDITERRRAEEALRASEAQVRAMVELASIGIAQADPGTGRWLRVNRRMSEITGYTRDELLALELSQITHPEDATRDWAEFQSVIRGEKPEYRLEKRYIRKDGSIAWVNVNMTLLRDADGRPMRTIATIEDITERRLAADTLRASEQRYRSLFNGMTEGFAVHELILDGTDRPADYRFLDVNPAFERLTGLRRERVVGKSLKEILPGESPHWIEVYGNVALTGDPAQFEDSSTTLGRTFEVFAYRNAPLQFAAVFKDVTERKRAEEALRIAHRQLRQFVDSNLVGIMIAGTDGGVIEANDYYLDLIGFTREELERGELDWRTITPPEWVAADEVATGELHERGRCTPYEKEYLRRDGTRVAVYFADAILAGPDQRIAAFAVDITERKRLELELRRLNEELERRVAGRTVALEETNRELEAFSYSVSHDLRAPLRVIDGFSRMLEERSGPGLDSEAQRMLGVVRDYTRIMSVLIDDLLALSRLGRSEMRHARLEMASLVREALAAVLPPDVRDRYTVTVGDLPDVMGDPGLIRQVWVNLLSNAVKFSGPRERPRIEVSAAKDGEMITFRIDDNGVGFDMAYAEKLFGVFQRLHSAREFPGTGVGLALVRRIVARHGGTTRGEGAVGEGARFSFSLPVGAEEAR